MCLFIALIAEIQFLLLLFLSLSSSLAAHIKLNFWARSCHVKSLSYQHPLCLSPGCYLIGFHLPSLPLSLCWVSTSAGLAAWAAELCAKSACDWFAYSWQVENCFFLIFFYFIPLLVATRYLCVFDAILVVCREASLASPPSLLSPSLRLLTFRLLSLCCAFWATFRLLPFNLLVLGLPFSTSGLNFGSLGNI